jgi:hypothetical protein
MRLLFWILMLLWLVVGVGGAYLTSPPLKGTVPRQGITVPQANADCEERAMAKRRETKKPRVKNVMLAEADVLTVHHPKHIEPAIMPRAATIEIAPKAVIKRRTLWQFLFG